MYENKWVNYHKHTSLSNRYMKDSPLLPIDYWNELKERYGSEPCIYTTVEHGWAGNYFNKGKNILTILNDTGERYLSTDLFAGI